CAKNRICLASGLLYAEQLGPAAAPSPGASPSGTRGTGRQGTRLLWCRPRRSLHRPEFTRSPCRNKRHEPDIGRRYAPRRRHRRVCQGVRRGKGASGLGRDEPILQARLRHFEAGDAGRAYGSSL
ncbi:unnamed protein product, partial [Ectocarpus sp. 12 AP-2014]